MKKKYKKLLGNSAIFAIGNFGSKIMQFIMVPIYSYTLTTREFGKVDLLTSLIALLAPIVCLDIYDGVFRFALDKVSNKKKIFSTGIFTIGLSSILIIALGFVLKNKFTSYPVIYTAILLIVTILYSLVSNYARALGYVKQFAVAGVINTIVMGLSNILLLVVLKMKMAGYMQSLILGQIVATIYLFLSTQIKNDFKISAYDSRYLKDMLIYSVPLMPNAIAWWLNSTSDRFFIIAILGAGANGVYAMANRLPSAISNINYIFFQSWQMSVVEEYNKKNGKAFISSVFDSFYAILFISSIALISIIRPLFQTVISHSYYVGWRITPFLILAVVYTSFASFLGTIYTANKRTVRILMTTLYGAIINVVLTILLLKLIGIDGAAIANVTSFAIVSLLRYKDIKKLGKIEVSMSKLFYYHIIYILDCVILFLVKEDYIVFVAGIILIVTSLFFDKNLRKATFGIVSSVKKRFLMSKK